MGYTLTWKAGDDPTEIKANYLSQEDAERQADAYAEAPGAPAPQHILDPDDVPVVIYENVESAQAVVATEDVRGEVVAHEVTEKEALAEGEAGVKIVTQAKLEAGADFDTRKAEIIAKLEADAKVVEGEVVEIPAAPGP